MEPFGNFGWGMGFGFGWLLIAVFWVLVVLGIIHLINIGRGPRSPQEETPLDILKKRYARGEIGKEEFEEKRKDLG